MRNTWEGELGDVNFKFFSITKIFQVENACAIDLEGQVAGPGRVRREI